MYPYEFKVHGMHCKSCAMLIKEDLGEVAGISNITVDEKNKTIHLVSDKKIDRALLAQDLTKYIQGNGYTLSV